MIAFFTLMLTALNFMNSYTLIEDTSNLPSLNPDLQNRKTLKIRLNNGLEALLISDEFADQSAAAVRVGVGSWSDPPEYPGMAHFCEHMLFMGTQKYPSENEFFSLISDYAGGANAFTTPNRTVYMFSAQTSGFLPLLDRFAHFFIDPLFNPENIAREMHAVDQEFAKNIENDHWREFMIFKETANPDHPIRMFSTGNSETLGKIPKEVLKQWHQEHYGSDRMHLVLYSPLPIEKLQEVVVQTFSQVPMSSRTLIDSSAPLCSTQQLGQIVYIKPIKNRQTLTLSWELPPTLSDDETKSIDILAYALRRGHKNSLYEKLKEEQLIDTMSVQIDEMGGKVHRFFQISLELTKKGIEEIDRAILRCFQAIALFREKGVPKYLFEEKNTLAQIHYQYQERQNPFDYITRLADTLSEENLSSYPRNTLLSKEYNPEKITASAFFLTPHNCLISLMAPPELTKVTPDRKEKWMGAEYALRPIPEKWLSLWASAGPNEKIQIAPPNPFIPENFALVPGEGSTPELIADDDLGVAYYVRSPEFSTPDSAIYLHVLSKELKPSPRGLVLASLYVDHLTDLLHPTLAAARSAGLFCFIGFNAKTLQVQISGFSDKAPLLLQQIAKQMPLDPPTEEQFAIYVDRHEKAYLNAEKELAASQAKELADSILNLSQATKREKLAALKKISYRDFLAFHQNLFEKTYCQALFAGNLSLKEAEKSFLDVIHVLGKAPFPKELHPQAKILQLPHSSGPYKIAQKTGVQGGAALLLIDEGIFTHEKRAAQEILSSALKEPFFSELRSKQKTAYIAQSDSIEIEDRLFQYFIVQSNSHQPEELLFRFEQFIESFHDQQIPKKRFETLKESLISSLLTRFRNLQSKAALWDRLAFEKDGDFTFIEDRISALKALSYDDFLKFCLDFLGRQNRKRLAILFEGRLAHPFGYQAIDLPQIQELATYAPRIEKKSLQASASAAN